MELSAQALLNLGFKLQAFILAFADYDHIVDIADITLNALLVLDKVVDVVEVNKAEKLRNHGADIQAHAGRVWLIRVWAGFVLSEGHA